MTKRVRRIEDFEKYIQLIPGRLGFGCAPRGTGLDELTIHHKVNVIVNIRQAHPKINVMWYKEKTGAHVLHVPLEPARNSEELVDSRRLLEQARMVASIVQKDVTKHVFIHGFDAYNYTSVFALLVWTFTQPQNFDPLVQLKEMYGEDLSCDFPRTEGHREQLMNIIRESRKDIFSAFSRVSKKLVKRDEQSDSNGASGGASDVSSGHTRDFGNDPSVAGGTTGGVSQGVQGTE